jgi:hypothetical protein
MKALPRRDFLLYVLAACGTPLVVRGQAPQAQAAASYFGAGVESARAIGAAYLRQINLEPTRASILEHTGGTMRILAAAKDQKAALTALVGAVRRDFQDGRVVHLEGWIVSRTEAELCALTLLPAAV